MRSGLEYVGTADEIARAPIGERDLAAVRRNIKAAHNPAAQHEDAAMRLALTEEIIAGLEVDAISGFDYPPKFRGREVGENIGGAGDAGLRFEKQDRAARRFRLVGRRTGPILAAMRIGARRHVPA